MCVVLRMMLLASFTKRCLSFSGFISPDEVGILRRDGNLRHKTGTGIPTLLVREGYRCNTLRLYHIPAQNAD